MAMLLAYWVFVKATGRAAKSTFDWRTPTFCIAATLVIWLGLFREDSLAALPKMIHYWSGQQKTPRLPGPHDYYFRLMLLYELPLVLLGIYGAAAALLRRTPFTDLLLWWTVTSIALYAIANEKVPWLLVHQILPMCLLAGYGLAQLDLRTPARRLAIGIVLIFGAVFLLRHVVATNFQRAADRHEPLLFAQTTEKYRDTLLAALKSTATRPQLGAWTDPAEQWPAAWYLRPKSPLLDGSAVSWATTPPPESTLRLIICSPQRWENLHLSADYGSWHAVETQRYVWPRPSWKALAPQRFVAFWWDRKANGANGVLAEDSTLNSVIAWKSVQN
jgi:hypothetical protein